MLGHGDPSTDDHCQEKLRELDVSKARLATEEATALMRGRGHRGELCYVLFAPEFTRIFVSTVNLLTALGDDCGLEDCDFIVGTRVQKAECGVRMGR